MTSGDLVITSVWFSSNVLIIIPAPRVIVNHSGHCSRFMQITSGAVLLEYFTPAAPKEAIVPSPLLKDQRPKETFTFIRSAEGSQGIFPSRMLLPKASSLMANIKETIKSQLE